MKMVNYQIGDRRFSKNKYNHCWMIRTYGGWVKEHLHCMEKKIGRFLFSDELVHHIDFDHNNNDINNLVVMTKPQHRSIHNSNLIIVKMADVMSENSCKHYVNKIYLHSTGYRLIRVFGGYVLEHRFVMEKRLGRATRWDEAIHHKDNDRLNNKNENLILMDYREHHKLHGIELSERTSKKTYQSRYNKSLRQWRKTHVHPNLGKKYSDVSKLKMREAKIKRYSLDLEAKCQKYYNQPDSYWQDKKNLDCFYHFLRYLQHNKPDEYKKHELRLMALKEKLYDESNLKRIEAVKQSWANPEDRSKRIQHLKEGLADPACRKLRSDNARLHWQNPESRANHLNAVQNPDARKASSERARLLWQNPEYVKNRYNATHTPEHHKLRSEIALKSWQNPDVRARRCKAMIGSK